MPLFSPINYTLIQFSNVEGLSYCCVARSLEKKAMGWAGLGAPLHLIGINNWNLGNAPRFASLRLVTSPGASTTRGTPSHCLVDGHCGFVVDI